MKKRLVLVMMAVFLNAGDMVKDDYTGLMWQDNRFVESERVSYQQAEKLCANLRLGGYSDWRIPSLQELLTLVNYGNYDPAIINGFNISESDYYWSSTQFMGDPDKSWGVDFKDGSTEPDGKSYDRHVRCVRTNK